MIKIHESATFISQLDLTSMKKEGYISGVMFESKVPSSMKASLEKLKITVTVNKFKSLEVIGMKELTNTFVKTADS